MQVQVKKSFYQSFGGINFMNADLVSIDFSTLATQTLGSRSLSTRYSYADLLKHLFFSKAIGGNVLDDINTLKGQLKDHPQLKIASPDTIEYAFKELVQPTKKIITASGKEHFINEHKGFNTLFSKLCMQTGLLNSKDQYTLDYDGHIVENTKIDNASTYKKSEGYYPVMCSINKLPIYVQNRNGNTPESYKQQSLIRATLQQCAAEKIIIGKFRADACCYEKSTIELLENKNITYYIRAEQNENLRIAFEDERDWQPAMLNNCKVEICSMEEPILGNDKLRRIVAYRRKLSNEQATIFDNNGYRYQAIVTSDKESESLDVIMIYNKRGSDGEHHFKELDYDFSWNKLPFDSFEMNTIYMYATAIAYILFQFMKKKYSAALSFINPTMRLKNFILHFVTLVAKWIHTGRQWILKIFTPKDYSPLWCT